jgi:predicted lipase
MNNWIADVKFNQMACAQFGKDAKCSTGFLGFWEESKKYALKGIEAGLVDNPTYTLVVTGHSLGGAAAVYAAAELRKTYKTVALVSLKQ